MIVQGRGLKLAAHDYGEHRRLHPLGKRIALRYGLKVKRIKRLVVALDAFPVDRDAQRGVAAGQPDGERSREALLQGDQSELVIHFKPLRAVKRLKADDHIRRSRRRKRLLRMNRRDKAQKQEQEKKQGQAFAKCACHDHTLLISVVSL